jgi:ComF family protein
VCPSCLAQPQPFQAEYLCAACRTPFANEFPLDENGLCGLCRRGMRGFDAAYSYGEYSGALRKLIQLLKYSGIQTLAEPLAQWMSLALPRDRRFDLIVPMPMHWRRRWLRRFNQSDLLARALARRTGLPVVRAARKRRATPPQAGLTGPQRRANVVSAFQARRPAAIRGRSILLVDDVLTTGATAAACARVLKSAGAASVTVITVARADRRAVLEDLAAAGAHRSGSKQRLGSLIDGKSGSIA